MQPPRCRPCGWCPSESRWKPNPMHWRQQWQTAATLEAAEQEAALKALGLEGASEPAVDLIKQKYRDLAHHWHPDRHSGAAQKAAAEVEFKRIGQAFASLQRLSPIGHGHIAIDPFGGVPWYHYTRYPPWSFARGPPYAPRGFWGTILLGGAAVIYSALLFDAANPAFGERRVQRLIDRETDEKRRRLAARADDLARAQEMNRVARDHMRASFEAAHALKEARVQEAARARAVIVDTCAAEDVAPPAVYAARRARSSGRAAAAPQRASPCAPTEQAR